MGDPENGPEIITSGFVHPFFEKTHKVISASAGGKCSVVLAEDSEGKRRVYLLGK